jgi:2'-5' RNA ligase
MRLFIAVAADDEVKAAAAEAVARLRRAGGSFRWVDPRDMHTTLRYFGLTPEEKLPEIRELMSRAASRRSSSSTAAWGRSIRSRRRAWSGSA